MKSVHEDSFDLFGTWPPRRLRMGRNHIIHVLIQVCIYSVQVDSCFVMSFDVLVFDAVSFDVVSFDVVSL